MRGTQRQTAMGAAPLPRAGCGHSRLQAACLAAVSSGCQLWSQTPLSAGRETRAPAFLKAVSLGATACQGIVVKRPAELAALLQAMPRHCSPFCPCCKRFFDPLQCLLPANRDPNLYLLLSSFPEPLVEAQEQRVLQGKLDFGLSLSITPVLAA